MSEETNKTLSEDAGPLRYVTFSPETTAEIKKYLDAGGVRIRVVPNADGTKWKITVLSADGDPMGWENDSFPCPPACS